MDSNAVPGAVPAVPAVSDVGKASTSDVPENAATIPQAAETDATKPAEPVTAAPVTASTLEAGQSEDPAADPPKPVTVEDVKDDEAPAIGTSATAPTEPPAAVPEPSASEASATAAAEAVKETAEESTEPPAATGQPEAEVGKPIAETADPTKAEKPGVDDAVDELVVDKPSAANGDAAPTEPSKDVKMTGALLDTDIAQPTAAPATEAKPSDENGEAETQPSQAGEEKRKADELEESANGDDEASAKKRRKAGRPAKTNGATNGGEKESVGHKVAKKVQKVLPPVGKTERKTRSQGPV
ncbi:hypothetical protein ACRALDRAFT_1075302 [Sodiomyces alcalophilus JCM 7366]|uniref:uncharacterized protein n=1 Tax=Sodiomyces alcalophilus JCM 7366 TaxID=591952 RepID=UPI0039B66CD6